MLGGEGLKLGLSVPLTSAANHGVRVKRGGLESHLGREALEKATTAL